MTTQGIGDLSHILTSLVKDFFDRDFFDRRLLSVRESGEDEGQGWQ